MSHLLQVGVETPRGQVFVRSEIQLVKLGRLGLAVFLLAVVTFVLAAAFSRTRARRDSGLLPASANSATRPLEGFAGFDWTVRGGTWIRQEGGLAVIGPSLALTSFGEPDGFLEVSLGPNSARETGELPGAVFRFEAARGGYRVGLDPSTEFRLTRMGVGGSGEILARVRAGANLEQVQQYRIDYQGSRIRVWWNGELVLEYQDSAPPVGTGLGVMIGDAGWVGSDLRAGPLP